MLRKVKNVLAIPKHNECVRASKVDATLECMRAICSVLKVFLFSGMLKGINVVTKMRRKE